MKIGISSPIVALAGKRPAWEAEAVRHESLTHYLEQLESFAEAARLDVETRDRPDDR